MLEEMFALLAHPDDYVCRWRNGELYIVREPHSEDRNRQTAVATTNRRGPGESARPQNADLTLA